MNIYEDPLATRYASSEMVDIFSYVNRISKYRKIWCSLAKSQQELGVSITEHQITSLEKNINNINISRIKEIEEDVKHDIVANLKAYGEVVPNAAPILHLGATSATISDNADILQQIEALQIILNKLKDAARKTSILAYKYADLFCVGYTHFQPAQPITIGKRFCQWLQDLIIDIDNITNCIPTSILGLKGATGTQSSFLSLFYDKENPEEMAKKLDKNFCLKFWCDPLPISTQTYTRKIDVKIADAIANLGITLHKIGIDLRLLASTNEIREGFSKNQVGSSAMPYKRNPINAERLCALSRLLWNYRNSIVESAASQWLERTLDDSALRRIVIPDQFLTVDGALKTFNLILDNLEIDEKKVKEILNNNYYNYLSEIILANCVKFSMDRQITHEKLRKILLNSKDKQKDLIAEFDIDIIIFCEKQYESTITGRSKQMVKEYIKKINGEE